MLGIVARVSGSDGVLLVERQLAHAVDGVVDVLAHVGHTVLGALQHHAAAINAAEVGTLDGVQQSAGVDRAETIRCESIAGRIAILLKQFQVFRLAEYLVFLVGHVADADVLFTLVLQLEVGTFAVGERAVLVEGYGLLQSVVVGAVVGDVQLTVALHQREVATAIDAAGVLGAYGDEVAVIDVVERRRGVAVYGGGVGILRIAVRRHVAAAEDGVVDGDAALGAVGILGNQVVPSGRPDGAALGFLAEGVQVASGHIVESVVGGAAVGHAAAASLHLQIG